MAKSINDRRRDDCADLGLKSVEELSKGAQAILEVAAH
jgi:hypothetical protein